MKIPIAMVAFLLLWPFSGGKTFPMTTSSQVPAASGTVKVQKDKTNGDLKLDIKVKHLARPSNLTPPAEFYIVWIQPKDGSAVKQGAIGVNNHLDGEFKVETVSKNFQVLITAEQSKNVTSPSGTELMHADVSMS